MTEEAKTIEEAEVIEAVEKTEEPKTIVIKGAMPKSQAEKEWSVAKEMAVDFDPAGNNLTFHNMLRFSKILVESGLAKDANDISRVIAIMTAGKEMGLSPMASLQNIEIVCGKVGFTSNYMLSLVRQYGYNYKWLSLTEEKAEIEIFDRDKQSLGTYAYTINDAKKEGLLDRKGRTSNALNSYDLRPRTMLMHRCSSNGIKAMCPEILRIGRHTIDELKEE